MEVIQLTKIVDLSVHLHLDIPTQIDPKQVNIMLVIYSVVDLKIRI